MTEKTPKPLEQLSDQELVAIWLASPDPENPTPLEKAVLQLMEARGVDF